MTHNHTKTHCSKCHGKKVIMALGSMIVKCPQCDGKGTGDNNPTVVVKHVEHEVIAKTLEIDPPVAGNDLTSTDTSTNDKQTVLKKVFAKRKAK